MNTTIRKILVCRTDALGDTLLTLPVCTALKQALPQVQVTLLVSPYTQSIVEKHPDVDRVLTYEKNTPVHPLVQALKQQRFDTALVVFPDRRVSWAIFLAGIPQSIGTGRRWWSFLFSQRIWHSRAKVEKHEADYNLDLVRAMGIQATLQPPRVAIQSEAAQWAKTYYAQAGVQPDEQLVIVHPGGHGSSANLSASQYGQVANLLMQHQGCKLLLTGSKAEQARLQEVAGYCSQPPLRLTEVVALPQLAALLARATVVVAGNTGPLHLACAVGRPVVTVFPASGVSGPKRWGPLGEQAAVITPDGNNESNALDRIRPEQVVEKVRRWLKK